MSAMLSVCMPYYRNRGMWRVQCAEYLSKWREALNFPRITLLPESEDPHPPVELCVCDDGSPEAERPDRIPAVPAVLLRHLEDRLWHQHAARNTAALYARAPWLLLTDMDHALPADSLLRILAALPSLDKECAYQLERVETDGSVTRNTHGVPKPHPNTWLMTRQLYWRIGGYDERHCGGYGTDAYFRRSLPRIDLLPGAPIVRYHRGVIADASTNEDRGKRKPPPKDGLPTRLTMEHEVVWDTRT